MMPTSHTRVSWDTLHERHDGVSPGTQWPERHVSPGTQMQMSNRPCLLSHSCSEDTPVSDEQQTDRGR